VDHPEVEPNNTKAQAQLVVMACGDTITGTTTGSSPDDPGLSSADTFLIRTAGTGSLTEYTLTMTSGVLGQTLTVRGLTQSGHAINAGTDVAFATAVSSGAAKVVRWYGHGPLGCDQDIYVRVTGTGATVLPYVLTLTCAAVTPTPIAGSLAAGPAITVGIDAATDAAADTDLWVYDSTLTPIPEFGHDEPDSTGVTRAMAPGTYYVALGDFNTANNQVSPPEDGAWGYADPGAVLDFPNVTACSSSAPIATLDCVISNGASAITGTGGRFVPFEVAWYRFALSAPTDPYGIGSANPSPVLAGGSTLLTVAVTPGDNPPSTELRVEGNLSQIGGADDQRFYDDGTHGDVTAGDGVFSYRTTVAPGTPDGTLMIPYTVEDEQDRSGNGNLALAVGYCAASTSFQPCNAAYEYIARVQLGTIDNSSDCTQPAYENFTALAADLPQGGSAPITVTVGNAWPSDYGMVWVDWNNDGSFLDAGEGLALSPHPLGASNNTLTGTVVVPGCIEPGPRRMRVRLFYGSTSATPCGPTTYGNIEDYTINVVAANDPQIGGLPATAAVGSAVLLTARVCPGQNPPSGSLTVTGDLTSIGGLAAHEFYDDGTHGDVTAGDGIYSLVRGVPHAPGQGSGGFTVPVTVVDDLGRTATSSIGVTLTPEPTGSCCTRGQCAVGATEYNCTQGGGTYNGDGTDCTLTAGSAFVSPGPFPVAIPDFANGTPGVASATVTVPEGSGTVEILSVTVGLTHTWIGDLTLRLSNGSATAILVDRPGVPTVSGVGFGDNYNGMYTFVDGAAADIWSLATGVTGHDIPGGTYHPSGTGGPTPPTPSLWVFVGAPLAGTWTLQVTDGAAQDVGNITSFAIRNVSPLVCPPACGSADFNCDGDVGTDADIEAFFACLAGMCPAPPCMNSADFNGDGDVGTDSDIEAFFRVLAGGPC
jgi:subtilisin-like proprotein convertase family protein